MTSAVFFGTGTLSGVYLPLLSALFGAFLSPRAKGLSTYSPALVYLGLKALSNHEQEPLRTIPL